MAPDAEKTRLRHNTSVDDTDDKSELLVIHEKQELTYNQVIIDGTVYDISNFDHPGGDQIFLFGGNDVTIQYKMIHPHHTGKQLEKLTVVGQVPNYKSDYKFDTDFERELKTEVFKIVKRGKEFGTWGWYFRACCYLAIFAYLQFQWVTAGPTLLLATLYGISKALIGMNVQHDANHGAASKNPFWNNLFGLGADWIGGSKWLWQEQHWTHHVYTNHAEKDPDSFSTEPLMLWNEYPAGDARRKWFHAFQVFYYFPVLALYWVSSVFTTEILDLKHMGTEGVGERWIHPHVARSTKYAVFWRAVYILMNCVVPVVQAARGQHALEYAVAAVVGIILYMGVVEGWALAVLFSLSHNFETADRDPTQAARLTGQPVCWYKSQVETSCTYGGAISGYFTGGLNFQVEHHLFPRMSSSWYPYIAPTVRRVCAKHGVHYQHYPWIFQNMWSTASYLYAAGSGYRQTVQGVWQAPNPLKGQM